MLVNFNEQARKTAHHQDLTTGNSLKPFVYAGDNISRFKIQKILYTYTMIPTWHALIHYLALFALACAIRRFLHLK